MSDVDKVITFAIIVAGCGIAGLMALVMWDDEDWPW